MEHLILPTFFHISFSSDHIGSRGRPAKRAPFPVNKVPFWGTNALGIRGFGALPLSRPDGYGADDEDEDPPTQRTGLGMRDRWAPGWGVGRRRNRAPSPKPIRGKTVKPKAAKKPKTLAVKKAPTAPRG